MKFKLQGPSLPKALEGTLGICYKAIYFGKVCRRYFCILFLKKDHQNCIIFRPPYKTGSSYVLILDPSSLGKCKVYRE